LAWTIFFAALFCALPAVVVGSRLLPLYRDYFHSFVLGSLIAPGAFNKGTFFNLQGLVEYFTSVPKASPWVEAVSLLASVAAMLAIDLHATKSPHPRRDVWPFCGYMLGCLLVSPAAEIHHLVLAIPAVFLLALKMTYDHEWRARGVVLFAALFLLSFDVGAATCRTMPFYFVALVALLVLLFLCSYSQWENGPP
jgi:hypothetical protein